mmetsp:Transcript_19544/g.14007  ORF Transcript_19544/g.14007 Transcript_19544/m.14007 type:complete len:95 (-) Transcript_19544:217-501(-)
MLTGKHTVCDIYCKVCTVIIGWSYIKAHEEDQKYKEGKFIIERAYITKKSSALSNDTSNSPGSDRPTANRISISNLDQNLSNSDDEYLEMESVD